jgi:hypothetical protein
MKKILFAVALLPLLFSSACKNKYDGFDMIYRKDFAKAIPVGASTFLSHYFLIEDIKPNFKSFSEKNAASLTDVQKIIPKYMRITARFADANWGFVLRTYAYIYPHGNPSKKLEIFYREEVPIGTGTTLDLNAGLADVKKLLSNDTDTFDIEIRMDFRTSPPTTIETYVDFSFLAVTSGG